jgi:hypothetical protein
MNFLFDGEFYSNAILILFQHLRVKRIFSVFRLGYLKFALAVSRVAFSSSYTEERRRKDLHHTPTISNDTLDHPSCIIIPSRTTWECCLRLLDVVFDMVSDDTAPTTSILLCRS